MSQDPTADFNRLFRSILQAHPMMDKDNAQVVDTMAGVMADAVKTLQAFPAGAAPSWAKSVLGYQDQLAQLWASHLGQEVAAPKDPRFKHEAWATPPFAFLRDTYLLTAKTMADMADAAQLPPHQQRQFSFYTRLMSDALSPTNFAMTNPEVLQRAQDTKGNSLKDGFANLVADLEKGYLSTTDETAFSVGGNLATTPGSVVFQNELFELIQYHPLTPMVDARPVLIIPPCVNKFYIFDINDKKSMVRYLLEQGLSVFIMSWRNPSPDLPDFTWDDHIDQGIFTALTHCADISGAAQVDLMSWCNGGTMLLVALAVMAAKLKARVGTATFLSSMIDFSDPGGVEVFIDRPQLAAYGQRLRSAKVAPGRDIAQAMAMLHVNDSIWNFVVGNYLLGKTPPPFDILFWNADTSNLPAAWYSYYIEQMYLENRLKDAGALTVCGRPVDVGRIDVPCYFVAATGDHIVPWKTSYVATSLVGGPAEFVLTDGGHVSGTVINHPVRSRRSFVHSGNRGGDAEAWQHSGTTEIGSWWDHWLTWRTAALGAAQTPAPAKAGNKTHPIIGPAPGAYVSEKVSQNG